MTANSLSSADVERLKETGTIRFETEGKNAGCWVMPTDLHAGTDEHDADKIIVRSNGTVTYAGKDIAYQLWKLGKLGADFYYKPFRTYPDGHTVWITTTYASEAAPAESRPSFGGGRKIYNVIDSRQSYTQEIVLRGTAAVAPDFGRDASVHLAYEMVALSPTAAEKLGFELSPEAQQRSHIEMSGRKGLGVKADDLINELESSAKVEVMARHPELSNDERDETARTLAVGALRFYLLKWTRNSLIAFDFHEALSTKGETGPYCQYAAVRANSIFRKLQEGEAAGAVEIVRSAADAADTADALRRVFEGENGTEIWALVALASRLDDAVTQAATLEEPSHLAKYAFGLARAFNNFYHHEDNRILEERDPVRRAALVVVADLVRKQLTAALSVLGIEVPARM